MICFIEKKILKILFVTPRRGAHDENLVKFYFTIIIESESPRPRFKTYDMLENNTLGSKTRLFFIHFANHNSSPQGIDTFFCLARNNY